jgi:hypothetical protein
MGCVIRPEVVCRLPCFSLDSLYAPAFGLSVRFGTGIRRLTVSSPSSRELGIWSCASRQMWSYSDHTSTRRNSVRWGGNFSATRHSR